MTNIVDILNADNGFDILLNFYNLAQELSSGLFIYITIPLPFVAIWVLSKKIVLPATLYTIIGGPAMILAPCELKGPAMLMFIFGVSGIIYKWFKDSR